MIQNYLVRLQKNGDFPYISDDQVYNISYGSHLKFILCSKKLFNMTPILLTNLPNQKTQKVPYSEEILEKQFMSCKKIEKNYTIIHGKFQNEWSADFKCDVTGSLFLQLIFINNDDYDKKEFYIQDFGKAQWILVDPTLNEEILNLRIQTLLTKQIGSDWKEFLRNQNLNLKYNAFHFPPVQELGQSQSLYSIKNQHKLNSQIFQQSNDLKQIINYSNKCLNCICFVDILLNHTSIDSEWLLNSDDSFYNLQNTPILNTAYILDKMLYQFSNDFVDQKINEYKKGNLIQDISDIYLIISLMQEKSKNLEIENYFIFNIDEQTNKFVQFYQDQHKYDLFESQSQIENKNNFNIFTQDFDDILFDQITKNMINLGYSNKGVSINFKQFAQFVNQNHDKFSIQLFKDVLNKINQKTILIVKEYLNEAFQNLFGQIEYKFQKCNIKKFNKSNNRLIDQYFTVLKNDKIAANNGWILNVNPTEDFIQSQNFNYLRRNVVIWTDLVKLRYGESKQDSKFLWKYMRHYVKQMSQIFQGIRLDNAHSTPLHVGQYFMQKARQYNKQIIIFCELFTDQQSVKVLYSKRLGSNMLVQETQNYDAKQLGDVIQQFGEFKQNSIGKLFTKFVIIDKIKYQKLIPQNLKEILYDQSHDNDSYYEKNKYQEQLPKMALLSFSNVMIGTNFGFDELYTKKISVVAENKLYRQQYNNASQCLVNIDNKKYTLNESQEQHEQNSDLIQNNENDQNQQNIIKDDIEQSNMNDNDFIGVKLNINIRYKNLHQSRKIFCNYHQKLYVKYPFMDMKIQNDVLTITRQNINDYKYLTLIARVCQQQYINPNTNIELKIYGKISKVKNIMYFNNEYEFIDQENEFQFLNCNINFESDLQKFAKISYKFQYFQFSQETDESTLNFTYIPSSLCIVIKSESQNKNYIEKIHQQFKNNVMDLSDLNNYQINKIFFSSKNEEAIKIYNIPNQGHLPFAGLFGLRHYIDQASKINDLSLQIYENLRQGNWLLDYLYERLPECKLKQVIFETFQIMKNLLRFLIPKYFTKFMQICYKFGEEKMLRFQNIQFKFQRNLIISSYQFIGDLKNHQNYKYWGRDTFISFKGILLIPGHLEEAKKIIFLFASYLKYGLIPNQLNQEPRYNCRDVCWWFIKSIDDYIQFSNDYKILYQNVNKKKLGNLVQEIFQSHAQGISFREENAGFKIDCFMESEGFDIELKLNLENGFIYGGNKKNCLTWMNKMGSSIKAGNQGKPATSRNGAPIELTCILKKCLEIVIKWNTKFEFPHKYVVVDKQKLFYKDWANLIQNNFEKSYFIPIEYYLDQSYNISKKYTKRRGIYRDCVGSQNKKFEYQLRPNGCIGYVLSPELFDKNNAAVYFAFVDKFLIDSNSIGVKTLDRISSNYSSYYDRTDDSYDFKIAHGFSCHNGPEWIWLYAYFVRGLYILNKERKDYQKHQILGYFENHQQKIQNESWNLTDENGSESQILSVGCILEAVTEIE